MSVSNPMLRFGPFTLDRDGHRLLQAGQEIMLRPKSFALLVYLIAHRQRVVSKDELLDAIWPGLKIEPQGVFQSISELRAAFAGHDFIRTVRGSGYQWIGAVIELTPCHGQPAARAGRLRIAAGAMALAAGLLGFALFEFDTRETPGAGAAAETEALLAQARTYLLDGKLDAAEAHFVVILERNPRHLEAKLDLAQLHLERGRTAAARRLGGEVHRAAIDLGTEHVRMASAVLMSNLPDDTSGNSAAWSYAREAVSIADRLRSPIFSAAGHERLGELYMAAGQHELATFELNAALENYQGSCPAAEQRVRLMLATLSPQA
jgi:DNA-binding winged helix-turn-helix (wHTH) protein